MSENHQSPYSREELAALRKRLEEQLGDLERDYPEVRPLPPMDEEEAKALLLGLMETATIRLLTVDESFLAGQLLSAFRMAVQAGMLGKRGRFFVIEEEALDRLMGQRT